MFRRRDHIAVILRAKGIDRLKQADSSNNSALSDIRMWMITKRLEQGCHHLPATSTNHQTIRQLSGIVQPRHHVYAFPY